MPGGPPQLPASPFRRAVPPTPMDRSGCIRRLLPHRTRPSPFPSRVGVHDFTFEACSGFTLVTAHRIARPPKAAFVTRLRPAGSPQQAARQLPDQPTTLWVDPSSTGDARRLGARRVEEGRGGGRRPVAVGGPFGPSPQSGAPWLRLPSPLIKPDVRISRIRLSDWLHLEAHGRAPSWSRRSRSTPSSPNTTQSG